MVKVELKGMWLNDDFKDVEPVTIIIEVENRKIISSRGQGVEKTQRLQD